MRLFDLEVEGQTPQLQKRKVRELITRERLPTEHPLREYIKGEAITAQDLKRVEVQQAIARYSAYRNGHGMFLPAICWKHSFRDGSRKGKVKSGRSAVWPNLGGTIFPTPAEIPITREGATLEEWDELKDSLVRSQSGVVLQFQAMIGMPWEAKFQLLVVDDNLTQTTLEEIVYAGGLYAGVGSWVSAGFGRYALMGFQQAELPEKGKIAGLLQPA